MPTPSSDPVMPFIEMTGKALSGDPVMLRSLAATLGAFSIRAAVALAILAATLWAAGRLARIVERGVAKLHRAQPADQTLSRFVSGLVRYLVIAIGLIAVLQQLGVQATSVLAVLGAASLAIGLALQGTLGNVAAGVMLLLLRPYRLGERVELNGRQGVVEGMDLFSTRLIDDDGLTLYMPNGKIFGDMIVNVSRSGRRRVELTFGIDYQDDIDLALKLLVEIAEADARVLRTPTPWSRVAALGDSTVNVILRCWAAPADWGNVRHDLMKQVKETFEAQGLSFPYPVQAQVDRTPRPSTQEQADQEPDDRDGGDPARPKDHEPQ